MIVEAFLPEFEDVLHGDHVHLHSGDLADRRHLAGAVREARLLDDEVDGVGDLVADRPDGQLHSAHQHHRLEPRQRIARRVRMQGGERAVVPGVHGLQHVERLAAAALAHHDPVRPHAQGVADEIANGDLALSLDVRRPRLELDPVLLGKLQLGRVLDGDDPFLRGDVAGQDVEQGGLPGARTARDDEVAPDLHAGVEELSHLRRERAEADQIVGGEQLALELADGDAGALQRQRRNDGVDAAAVGQAGVHQRRRFVDVPAERSDDALEDAEHGLRRAERLLHPLQPAGPLDVDLGRAVHHDLADGLVGEIGLERAEAEGLVDHVLHQLLAVEVRIQLAGLVHAGDDLPDGALGLLPQLVGSQSLEIEPAQIEGFDQPIVRELQRRCVVAGQPDHRGLRRRRRGDRRRRITVAPGLGPHVARARGRHRRLLGGLVAVLQHRLHAGPEVRGLDVEDEVADEDLVVGRDDLRSGELLPVHVRAVGRLQIEDDDLSVLHDDLGVLL